MPAPVVDGMGAPLWAPLDKSGPIRRFLDDEIQKQIDRAVSTLGPDDRFTAVSFYRWQQHTGLRFGLAAVAKLDQKWSVVMAVEHDKGWSTEGAVRLKL